MRYLAYICIYLGFFGVIGYTVYLTGSAYALWGLLLMPAVSHKDNEEEVKT